MAVFLEDEQLPHATEEAMAMIDALDEVLKQGEPDFFWRGAVPISTEP